MIVIISLKTLHFSLNARWSQFVQTVNLVERLTGPDTKWYWKFISHELIMRKMHVLSRCGSILHCMFLIFVCTTQRIQDWLARFWSTFHLCTNFFPVHVHINIFESFVYCSEVSLKCRSMKYFNLQFSDASFSGTRPTPTNAYVSLVRLCVSQASPGSSLWCNNGDTGDVARMTHDELPGV